MKEYFEKAQNNFLCNTSYPIQKEHWLQFKQQNCDLFENETDLSFYIHIPFCKKLCAFCEYIKYPKKDIAVEEQYVRILEKDINTFIKKHGKIKLHGFDVGGGTPTVLSELSFKHLMQICKKIIETTEVVKDFEASIEATFETIDESKLQTIYEAGFRRISLGIQTMNLEILRKNNRENLGVNDILQKCKLIKKIGIPKINIDFMYGLEGQTQTDLEEAILLVKSMNVEQVTLYEMRYNLVSKNKKVDRENLYHQYEFIYKKLRELGYQARFGQNTFTKNQSDFGLSSYLRYRMIHNVSYKGFGISAQSKTKKGISYNVGKTRKSLEECMKYNSFLEEDIYVLPQEELLAKYVAISMYYGKFSLAIMQSILNKNPLEYYKKEIQFLIDNNYIVIKNEEVILTKKGFLHYSAVVSLFYSKQVKEWLMKNK